MYSFAHRRHLKASLSIVGRQDEACDWTKSCFKPNESEQRQKQVCQSALVIYCWWVPSIPVSEPRTFPGSPEARPMPFKSSSEGPGPTVEPQQIGLCRHAVERLRRAAFPLSFLSYFLPAIHFVHIETPRL